MAENTLGIMRSLGMIFLLFAFLRSSILYYHCFHLCLFLHLIIHNFPIISHSINLFILLFIHLIPWSCLHKTLIPVSNSHNNTHLNAGVQTISIVLKSSYTEAIILCSHIFLMLSQSNTKKILFFIKELPKII